MRSSSVVLAALISLLGVVVARDESLYFDRTILEYETTLTDDDFKRAHLMAADSALNDMQYDTESMYSLDKFEGDIANPHLNASTIESFITGAGIDNGLLANAIRNRYQLWQKKVPYAISSQYSSYSRSLIASSMEEYAKHTCIQFVPRTNTDTNYVYIIPDQGCYSMVGKTGGRQTVSLGSGCVQKGIIIHELMHAVGFFHEQSRTDRDNYITILWNNIAPGMQGQFQKYDQGTIQTLGSQYDYNSIMHYGALAFSRNGQPTIQPKQSVTIGQRGGFSKVDIYKINKLYQCDGPTGIVTTTTPGPVTQKPVTQGPYTAIPTLPPVTRPPTIITSTEEPAVTPPTECQDTRRDCPLLSKQGWCKRNPAWMKEKCAVSCDMCEQKPTTICDDLRVDCHVLLQQRYCKTSPVFMKANCAKSCGFCSDFTTTTPNTTELPFTVSTVGTMPTTTEKPIPGRACRDRKNFCSHWKKAGFCAGNFLAYMRKNCEKSCGLC